MRSVRSKNSSDQPGAVATAGHRRYFGAFSCVSNPASDAGIFGTRSSRPSGVGNETKTTAGLPVRMRADLSKA